MKRFLLLLVETYALVIELLLKPVKWYLEFVSRMFADKFGDIPQTFQLIISIMVIPYELVFRLGEWAIKFLDSILDRYGYYE